MNKLEDSLLCFGGAFLGAAIAFAYAKQVPDGDLGALRIICSLLGVALLGTFAMMGIKKYLKENP